MSKLACALAATTIALGLGGTAAFAQEATSALPATTSQTSSQTSSQAATPGATSRSADGAIKAKAGNPDCIRDTGTHIRTRSGHCLPVAGRSYSREELQRTGQIDTGRALQMLDPSVTLGH